MMWFKALWLIDLLWAALIFILLKLYVSGYFGRFLDSANQRSLHRGEVLTAGGFLLFTPIVIYLVCQQLYVPALLVASLTLLGLFDDVRHLSARFRFLVQLVVVVVTLWHFGFDFSLWWLFLCLAFLWWLNLFNFMDGANGLVALHAMVTLIALLFLHTFPEGFRLMIALVVVSLFIYLYFNVKLNVLFMGDSGSLPLAFIIAFLSIMALKAGSLTVFQIVVMHAVLITDSTLTLAVRCYRRERLSEAHRNHLYQRLIGEYKPHLPVSSGYAAVTLLCCVLALAMAPLSLALQGLCLLMVYSVLAVVFIHYRHLNR